MTQTGLQIKKRKNKSSGKIKLEQNNIIAESAFTQIFEPKKYPHCLEDIRQRCFEI